MLKSIVKTILILILSVSPVFANEDLSIFHQQGYVKEPDPIGQEAFYARKAPMFSEASGYFGMNVGGGIANMKPEISMERDGGFVGEIERQDRTGLNSHLGLFAGYGKNFGHFYIGGELSTFYSFLKKTIKGSISDRLQMHRVDDPSEKQFVDVDHNLEMSIEQPITVAFDIRPGYLNTARNRLFYARAGIGAGLVRLKLTDTFGDGKISTKANRIKLGYRLGAGIEYFVSKSLGLRIEYVYSFVKAKDDHIISDDELRRLFVEDIGFEDFTSTNVYKYIYGTGSMGIHMINLSFSIHP